MTRWVQLLALAVLGALGALTAELAGASNAAVLIVLSTALVLGEQFQLRPTGRAALPLSFAVVVVLIRAADPWQFVVVVIVAYAVAVPPRTGGRGLLAMTALYAERLVEALGAAALYTIALDTTADPASEEVVLGALAAAAVVQIVVADLVTYVQHHSIAPLRARGADLALVTSAMLMAVGYGGIAGAGELGLWGPLLFSIPLLAAWYSFELLRSTRRNFWQTIEALGAAPELAGLVRPGHATRVAALAVEMGLELGLTNTEIEQLEMAANLHHLGAVCLDAPTPSQPLDPVAVAEAGSAMLRDSEVLAAAGDIVAAEPLLHRAPESRGQHAAAFAGQILKLASAFDELTEGNDEHAVWALEAIYTGPLYVYDGRVVAALERVLERRGVLPARV